jgi:thiol:disulfide interchange protein/DsbC/DsbD-like thiol-disulfide interchange protein
MVIRNLFLLVLLLAGGFAARASDPIDAPAQGASATVTQPHVTAELIPERTTIQLGQPFDIALHLHADPGWHTYWINPGDAGLATTIKWTLPSGFTAGPIQWPTPEKHNMGPLVTYGYAGDVYLITTITPPSAVAAWPKHMDIKAKARWLVCQEECIPGQADLTVSLDSGLLNLRLPVENKELFAQARERLPFKPSDMSALRAFSSVTGVYEGDSCEIKFVSDNPIPETALKTVYFFPEQSNVLSTTDNPQAEAGSNPNEFLLRVKLQQNGDKPDKLSGVLVSDQPLVVNLKAVYISEFPVTSEVAGAGPRAGSVSPSDGTATTSAPALSQTAAPSQGPATATPQAQPLLLAVLGAAFIGGLILNLMPCVLPVLSLKVFSLMKHAGENPKAAWLQGVAFTAGVVISFWVLAGLLLALRAAGNQLGWGFQMQSPGFVLGLIFLFFLLGLNLFGVFELGASLVGLDAKATGHLGGLASSFGNGALATLAATPCTAPFMGSALGFAAQQPPIISLLIFTFLAFGMATPYLLLTIFPGALRFVPKPGAWMEAFKQFMGFLLMATVIYLIYVFGALRGADQIPELLFLLLLWALAAWIYGRWGTRYLLARIVIVTFLVVSFFMLEEPPASSGLKSHPGLSEQAWASAGDWQPWSQTAVDAALAKGQPVFVDFTAAWCLSCKVNEAVALGTDAVKQAFTQKNVVLFRADWTHSDPEISKTLQAFNRDGVPLYLLYSPKSKDAPQILPEVLTPGIVLDALNKL